MGAPPGTYGTIVEDEEYVEPVPVEEAPPPVEAAPPGTYGEVQAEPVPISPGLGGNVNYEEPVPQPGLGGVADPSALPPPPGPMESAIHGAGEALGPVGDALMEGVPGPVQTPIHNVMDAAGQFVGGATEGFGEVIDSTLTGDPGEVMAAMGRTASPINRVRGEAERSLMAGEGSIEVSDVVENPANALAALGRGVADVFGVATPGGKMGVDEWVAAYPEEAREASLRGPDGLMTAYEDFLFGSAEEQLQGAVNPLDAPGGDNVIQHAGNILGEVPEMLEGFNEMRTRGDLGPFLGRMAMQAGQDPVSFMAVGPGEAVIRAGAKAVRAIPGVSKLTRLAPNAQAQLEGEQMISAEQELSSGLASGQQGSLAAPSAAPSPGTGAVPNPGSAGPPATPGSASAPPVNGGQASPGAAGVPASQPVGGAPAAGAPSIAGNPRNPYRVTYGSGPNRRVHEFPTAEAMDEWIRRNESVSPTTGAPVPRSGMNQLQEMLRQHLDQVGLTDVGIRVVPRINELLPESDLRRLADGQASAMHDSSRNLITVAYDHALDQDFAEMGLTPEQMKRVRAVSVVDHEIIHSMRSMDLFTPGEWRDLVRAVRDLDIEARHTDIEWREKAKPLFTKEAWEEEMIAVMYEDYRAGRLLQREGVPENLLRRIQALLQSLGQALRGTYPEQILQRIETGEVGRRPRTLAPGASRTDPRFSRYRGTVFHGSGEEWLDVLSASIPTRNKTFKNAAGQLGVFATRHYDEALGHAEGATGIGHRNRTQFTPGMVYEALLKLDNAIDMDAKHFYPTYDEDFSAAGRAKTRKKLAEWKKQGHDGIVVWDGIPRVQRGGAILAKDYDKVVEVISFDDLPVDVSSDPFDFVGDDIYDRDINPARDRLREALGAHLRDNPHDDIDPSLRAEIEAFEMSNGPLAGRAPIDAAVISELQEAAIAFANAGQQGLRQFAVRRRTRGEPPLLSGDPIPEPTNPPSVTTTAGDNPLFHMHNRADFFGPGPGAPGLTDAHIQRAFARADAEFTNKKGEGILTSKIGKDADFATFQLPSASAINAALSHDWGEILWYEDASAAMASRLDLPTNAMNIFANMVAGTSQNTKPYPNTLRGLAATAEWAQGRKVNTPSRVPKALAEAVELVHLKTPKFFNFSNTFKYLNGMIKTAPGATIDLQMSRSLGFPDNAVMKGETYQAFSRFYDLLRDDINALNPNVKNGTQPPIQVWQLQAAIWAEERGMDVTIRGNPIERALDDAIAKMQEYGVPLGPDGRITMDTLLDPMVVSLFGSTSDLYNSIPYASLSEHYARGVVRRAYETSLAMGADQVRFREAVQNPFRAALRKEVYPALVKMFTGEDEFSVRAIDFDGAIGGGDAGFTQTAFIPMGGKAGKGNAEWEVIDIKLAAAALADNLGLESVTLEQHLPRERALTTDAREMALRGDSFTYELYFPVASKVTNEALEELSLGARTPLRIGRGQSGGVHVVFQNPPGTSMDPLRVRQALESAFADVDGEVTMHPILRRTATARNGEYAALKGRLESDLHQRIRSSRPRTDDAAYFTRRLHGIAQFESAANNARADWEASSALYLADITGETPDPAHFLQYLDEPGPLTDADAQRIRDHAPAVTDPAAIKFAISRIRAGAGAAPEGLRRTIDGEILPETVWRRGTWLTQPSADILDQPAAGRLKFRDGATPTNKLLIDLAGDMHRDVGRWIQGFDQAGNPLNWTQNNRTWQTLNSRFEPVLRERNLSVRDMAFSHGVQPHLDPTNAAARHSFASMVFEDAVRRGLPRGEAATALGRAFNQYSNALRQAMLFNWLNVPRYMLQNLSSNSINMGLRGGGAPVVIDFFTSFPEMGRVWRNQRNPRFATQWNAIEKEVGFTRPNVQMTQLEHYNRMGGKREMTTRGSRLRNAAGQLISPDALKWAAQAPDQLAREKVATNAVFRGYKDLNARLVDAITKELHDRHVMIPPDRIRQSVSTFLAGKRNLIDPNSGTPYTTIVGGPAKFTPVWGAESLLKHLRDDLAGDAGRFDRVRFDNAIDRVYRDAKPAIRDIMDRADAQTNHALFDWRNTVGDELLSKAVLFHFWQTRQGGLYVTEGLRHPVLMASYARAMTQLEEDAERQDLPVWMKGFFRFANSPAGYVTWHSPFDVMQSLLTFADWQYAGDPNAMRDISRLGEIVGAIPFFVHPAIQFGAYSLGLLGPEYPAPPLLGVETFGTKFINLANLANGTGAAFMEPFNAMGIGVDDEGNKVPIPAKPLQELYAKWGNAISTALEPITGQSPISVVPSTATIDSHINTIIEQETRLAHPDWPQFQVNDHVTDVMADAGNPEYQAAYGKAAEVPFMASDMPQPFGAIARMISPVGMTAMPEQMAIDRQEGFEPTGALPPRNIDQNDPQSSYIENAAVYGATKTVEGRKLTDWQNEYYSLVDPEMRETRGVASAISKGTLEEPVTINGTTYQPEEIAGMEDWEQTELRKAYLAERGVTQDDINESYNAEDRYLATHVDYAAYQAYTDAVKNHPDGTKGFVAETSLSNPSFAQFVRLEATDRDTGEIDFARIDDPDAYLASIGERGSVYSPVVGNDPSTVPGGYPSIAGLPADRPILPQATVTGPTPMYDDPGDAAYGSESIATIVPEFGPIQVVDPRPKAEDGMILVQVGEYIGYMDGAMLNNAAPPKPVGPGAPVVQPGGGLTDAVGNVVNALGTTKDAIGNALTTLVGHNSGAPTKPQETSFTPGYTDVVPGYDGMGVQSTIASDRMWMENMVGPGLAVVTTDYKGPKPAGVSYDYQVGHDATNQVHAAYDISCTTGQCWNTPIYSPMSGTVVCSGYGNGQSTMPGTSCNYSAGTTTYNDDGTPPAHTITLEVGTDPQGNSIQLSFNHMGPANLVPGQVINPGDLIGGMGNGDCSSGPCPHMHLEGWGYSPALGTYRILDPQLIVSGYYQTHSVDGDVISPAQ